MLLWTTLPENRTAKVCDGHCGPIVKEGCDLTYAWEEYSGFYTLSSRGSPTFSTQGEACPSQIEGVRCEPGIDILVYPLSATSRCSETCVTTTLRGHERSLTDYAVFHQRDLNSVNMTVGDAVSPWLPQFFRADGVGHRGLRVSEHSRPS